MANEISVSVSLKSSKINVSMNVGTSFQADMTGVHKQSVNQLIGFAAHEPIELVTDLGTPGFIHLKNLDPTNFILIGVDVSAAFVKMIKLLPGEGTTFRGDAVIFAQADTADCLLQVDILEV